MTASRTIPMVALLLASAAPAADPPADPVLKAAHALYDGLRTETLPNGLRIVLKRIPEATTVTVMTAYAVGSADEDKTMTGLSHYLEHLMFKGTDKLMPGDIDRVCQRAGGQNNAYTTEDSTVFHFAFAADRWIPALEIEADRMRNLRIDTKHEFEQEKGAVIAELDGNEDEPWELEQKAILPLLFGSKSPYGHPIIGEKAHVRAVTAEIIKAYYDKWYHPNNATLIVIGGFDEAQALAKIKELFGPIPKGALPKRNDAEPVVRTEPVHKEIVSKFEVDRILMGFNTGRVGEPEDYVLDVISHLMAGGRSSRLFRRLVLDQEIAGEVRCANLVSRLPGWFSIHLEVMKGEDRKKAEAALLAELKTLTEEAVEESEIQRAKRSIVAGLIFAREDNHDLADGIATAVTLKDLDYLRTYLTRLQAVTAADVQRVAKTVFDPNKRAVVWSSPPMDKKEPVARRGKRPGPPVATGGLRKRARRAGEDATPSGKPLDLTATKRVVLDNGLTLLLLENRRLPILLIDAEVGRAHLYEPAEKMGVATLVGQLLEEGTEKRTEKEIARTIEDTGGLMAMSSEGGRMKVLSSDRAIGLDLFFDCLTRPNFPRDSVQRQREHLMSEIEDAEQLPNTKAQDVFLKMVYGEHPLGRPTNGTMETVAPLRPGDCREFHRRVFVPNNTTIVVVGDFETASMVAEIEKLTARWAKADLPKLELPEVKLAEKRVERIVTMPRAAQVNVYLGHIGIRRNDPDYYKLMVLDNVLGTGPGFTDRLSAKLRDRQGLAYTVSAAISSTAGLEPGAFTAYIGTYPDKFAQVRQTMFDEIARATTEAPTDDEVASAKQYLTGSAAFRLTTNEKIAGQLQMIERYGLGLGYLETFRKAIAAVTPADVLAVAKKHLHPDRLIVVAAGPIDKDGAPLPEKNP